VDFSNQLSSRRPKRPHFYSLLRSFRENDGFVEVDCGFEEAIGLEEPSCTCASRVFAASTESGFAARNVPEVNHAARRVEQFAMGYALDDNEVSGASSAAGADSNPDASDFGIGSSSVSHFPLTF
jgi:hypothetical protein